MRSWGILKFGTFWTGDYSQFLQWLKLREETKKASSSVQSDTTLCWIIILISQLSCMLIVLLKMDQFQKILFQGIKFRWHQIDCGLTNGRVQITWDCYIFLAKNWHWNKNNELSTVPNFTTFQNQPTLEKIPLSELF